MWTAYLMQTASGQIGPQISFDDLSWSIELNGTDSIQISLRKSELPNVDRSLWLAPWWGGVVICWNEVPIAAGPIIARPTESAENVKISCGGIRSVLAQRVVIGEYYNWTGLAKTNVSYSGLSLGTIAKRVVALVQEKPAGKLPISYAVPDETALNDADHQRNYRGFNVSNLKCDDVLTKLSNTISGPDIMFRPKRVGDSQLTFEMWNGTEKQPRISQTQYPVWDTTVEGDVVDMSTITTGSYQTSRVFATGAGQDEALIMEVATNTTLLQKGFPLLESVITSDSEKSTTVQGYAQSELAENVNPLLEIQMTIRADAAIPLGEFWPGDLIQVVTKGWISLPDGVNRMRLLAISGDASANLKVNLQMDDRYTLTQ
jgi:hypothetical protein